MTRPRQHEPGDELPDDAAAWTPDDGEPRRRAGHRGNLSRIEESERKRAAEREPEGKADRRALVSTVLTFAGVMIFGWGIGRGFEHHDTWLVFWVGAACLMAGGFVRRPRLRF